MSATAPSTEELRCTHADRDRVVELLKNAYADGRLDQAEFDARFDETMNAKTYVALERVTRGLIPGQSRPAVASVSADTGVTLVKPATPLPPPTTEERLLAGLAQATTLVPVIIAPAIMLYTVGKRSEFVRHHAAGALNLQITMLLVTMVTFGLGGIVYAIAGVLATAFAVVAVAGSPLRQRWVLPIFGRGGPYEQTRVQHAK